MIRTQADVELCVMPGLEASFGDFSRDPFPSYAVALDGFVPGPPSIDFVRPCVNFNHHEGVVRFATRATCEQVRVALDMGLYDSLLKHNGRPFAKVFVNDCDQDVCLSWGQLSRFPHWQGPLLTRIANVQGLLDMSAGSYPIHPDSSILREFAWIFKPYVEARMAGLITTMNAEAMRGVIDNVCARIDQYMLGRGRELTLDTSYEVLREGTSWKMVKMIGYYARIKMRHDGINVFISYRGMEGGAHIYSIGKEPFVPVNLFGAYEILSRAETSGSVWGGGDLIGSSQRGRGSTLAPDEVYKIFEEYTLLARK